MLQIEEWFRRPQRKPERKTVPITKPVAVKREEVVTPKKDVKTSLEDCIEDIFEPEDSVTNEKCAKEAQESVSLQDSVAEAEELEHISEEMGQDVSEMIDLNKEDLLLQQIDEFREKAKQLQDLMSNRKSEVEELQLLVNERKAKANDLDELIHVRQEEAAKIMGTVSDKIEKMSQGVSEDMNEITVTMTREMSGLSQNLTQNLTQNITHEINQASEKAREAFEKATQEAIDQNTRSLEGLKEQLEQFSKREQIEEISTEMNDKISTLKNDISAKIHSEDVKCYRNIRASMDEQSKLLTEGDEKTRQHLQEQFEQLEQKVKRQGVWVKLMFGLSLISVAGIVAMLLIQMNVF